MNRHEVIPLGGAHHHHAVDEPVYMGCGRGDSNPHSRLGHQNLNLDNQPQDRITPTRSGIRRVTLSTLWRGLGGWVLHLLLHPFADRIALPGFARLPRVTRSPPQEHDASTNHERTAHPHQRPVWALGPRGVRDAQGAPDGEPGPQPHEHGGGAGAPGRAVIKLGDAPLAFEPEGVAARALGDAGGQPVGADLARSRPVSPRGVRRARARAARRAGGTHRRSRRLGARGAGRAHDERQ